MSELTQRGKAFPLQLYSLSQGNRSWHFLQLPSSYGESITQLTTGHLQYVYHRRVGELGHWTLWAGTLVSLQASMPVFTARVGGIRYQNSQSPALLNSLNAVQNQFHTKIGNDKLVMFRPEMNLIDHDSRTYI